MYAHTYSIRNSVNEVTFYTDNRWSVYVTGSLYDGYDVTTVEGREGGHFKRENDALEFAESLAKSINDCRRSPTVPRNYNWKENGRIS